jgi:hypothetical protein
MKLWVVGANSPNQEDWSCWDGPIIVIASTPERALELADHFFSDPDICEIPMDKEIVVCQIPREPSCS